MLQHACQGRTVKLNGSTRVNSHENGFYFCFGEYDGVAITEAPDDSVALAGAMALIAPGHLKAIKTTKLFSVEESMEAMRKAGSLMFQGPARG